MQTLCGLFSFRFLIVSLASISVLSAANVIPPKSVDIILVRRVTVDGMEGELGERSSAETLTKSIVRCLHDWDSRSNQGYVVKAYNKGGVQQDGIDILQAVGRPIVLDPGGRPIVTKVIQGISIATMSEEVKDLNKRKEDVPERKPITVDVAARTPQGKGLFHEVGSGHHRLGYPGR